MILSGPMAMGRSGLRTSCRTAVDAHSQIASQIAPGLPVSAFEPQCKVRWVCAEMSPAPNVLSLV